MLYGHPGPGCAHTQARAGVAVALRSAFAFALLAAAAAAVSNAHSMLCVCSAAGIVVYGGIMGPAEHALTGEGGLRLIRAICGSPERVINQGLLKMVVFSNK